MTRPKPAYGRQGPFASVSLRTSGNQLGRMGNDDFSLQTDMHCIIIYISSLSSLCHHHRTCSCSFSMRDSSWPSSTCCLSVVPRFATIYVDHFVSCQKIVKASPIYVDHFVRSKNFQNIPIPSSYHGYA